MTTRVDLHCHSSASQEAKLGVQRAVGLPECATAPDEVYALAKRRGMDFVTITDHDTIAGVAAIADRPDVFVSEELTAWFRGEPQAVHVLCLGIDEGDHEWLQAHAGDVERVAEYLHEREIACALAHPFFSVAAPLTGRHRRRLADLFPVWESRNGARAPALNQPAAVYVDTHGGTGVGGSDDHAGVDVGRTWTRAPAVATPAEFLAHVRAGRAEACGAQGSPAKWAHAAIAIAARSLGSPRERARPDALAVLRLLERVIGDAELRGGGVAPDLAPEDARLLLAAWLDSVGLTDVELLAMLQADDFRHAELFRRARRCHERRLGAAVAGILEAAEPDYARAAAEVFDACLAAVPYLPAAAVVARERRKLNHRDGSEPLRVGLVADGIGATHGVTRTVEEIRERGVRGFDVEVIGTDPGVDRRLSAVADVEVPLSAGLRIGVPTLPAVMEALADGAYDLVHLCSPGPAGVAAALAGRTLGLPICGSYHTEFGAYAALRSRDPGLQLAVQTLLTAFYGQCGFVLSPSAASDARLEEIGVARERIGRWDRGVDVARFSPAWRRREPDDDRIDVLYAGRLTREKGIGLLADAFRAARSADPRLHLVVAGGGPEEQLLRTRLGAHVTFRGWLGRDDLAVAYASADLFLFCSVTDTFGQVLLEAQASGLPVVAVHAGGPAELVQDGRSGVLCPPDARALGAALAGLAASPAARSRLGRGGVAGVRDRTWDAALERLGAGWRRTLADAERVARAA